MLDSITILWRTFGTYRLHLLVLVVLGFFGAMLEGVGVGAAIPLLSFLVAPEALPQNIVTTGIQQLFSLVSVEFKFRFLLAFIVLLFLVRAAAVAAFGYIRGRITANFLYAESNDSLGRLFNSSWPYVLTQKLGNVHGTLVRDIQCVGNLLMSVSQVIQSLTGFLMYLAVALTISPLMTMYTVAGGAVLLGIVRPLLSLSRRVGERMTITEKNISQFIAEHVIGMKSLKAAGAEAHAMKSGRTLLETLRVAQIRMALARSLGASIFQPFTIIFVIIVFAVTYKLPGFNLISFAATLYLIQKIFTYIESGQTALHTIGEMLPHAEQLAAFKRELSAHAEPAGNGQPFAFAHAIRFEGVSFRYPEGGPVLRDISWELPRGKTVALIGPSGGGKTSIADLLLRLFEPERGRITIDGAPADRIALPVWRSHFGYVPQDVFLFNGTIEDNIRFYRPELTREALEHAAKQAHIYDFISSLPEGFQTEVGDRGVRLSGGQRQRLALARALAGKPDILLLDEATSSLDTESEKLIHEAIYGLRGSVTALLIAHRLSTVDDADYLLVLDCGRIAEAGTPDELRRNSQSYFSTHRGESRDL